MISTKTYLIPGSSNNTCFKYWRRLFQFCYSHCPKRSPQRTLILSFLSVRTLSTVKTATFFKRVLHISFSRLRLLIKTSHFCGCHRDEDLIAAWSHWLASTYQTSNGVSFTCTALHCTAINELHIPSLYASFWASSIVSSHQIFQNWICRGGALYCKLF